MLREWLLFILDLLISFKFNNITDFFENSSAINLWIPNNPIKMTWVCWWIEMLVWFVCLFSFFFGVSVCEEEPRWPFNEPCLEFPTLEKQQSFEALWSWLRLFLLWFYPCQSPSHTKQFEICVKRGNCQLPSELLICPILHMMYIVHPSPIG